MGHVDAFYMDTHAVTNLDYQQFLIEIPVGRKIGLRTSFTMATTY